MLNTIWVEKYRPQTIDDIIIPETIRNIFHNGIDNHLLFYGGPGLGKTSLAKIIAKDKTHLYINCSKDTGIDNVRTQITDFCSNMSLDFFDKGDTGKIVILDEFDGVSDAYMKAMRGTIESFSKTTKFIATCNFINKIPEYMQSRFTCINFNFDKEHENALIKQYIKRVYTIAKKEGLNIEPKVSHTLVKRYYPDLRSTISFLQRMKMENRIDISDSDINSYHGEHTDLYTQLESNNWFNAYKYAYANFLNDEDEAFSLLSKEFINYLIENEKCTFVKIGQLIESIADWSYKSKFVADRFSTLAACLYNINKILNG